jgi:hypothetical protein
MLKTKELDTNLLEATFYATPFKFSYSSMNKMLTAPAIFYREYVLKQKEDETKKYFLEGTLIHFLVLENQGFDDKFIVTSENLPSENSMKIAEEVFKIYEKEVAEELRLPEHELCDFGTDIIEILKEMNLHQALKDDKKPSKAGAPLLTGDEKRINKIVEPKTEEYFTFLKNKKGRTIIDAALLDKCTLRAEIIKSNLEMRKLLGLDVVSDGVNFGVYNELMLDNEPGEGDLFGYKGILDNMVIDVANKLVRINDFKTTGKSLVQFQDAIDSWNYWLQAVVYKKLVENYLKDVLTEEWKIEFRFLVFDKYDQMYPFKVTDETMLLWEDKFKQAEKEITYHYESKNFDLPYAFALGEVEL